MADQKYVEVTGGSNALYNGDAVVPDCSVVLVEGVFDALAIQQQVGDLVNAVATGSTTRCRRMKWIARLALAEQVLVAFDSDKAGEEAAAYWLRVLPNAVRWRPWWDDPNQLLIDGADLRAWLQPALHQHYSAEQDPYTGKQGLPLDAPASDAIFDQTSDPTMVQASEDELCVVHANLLDMESELEQLLAELGRTPGTGMEFARTIMDGEIWTRKWPKIR